MMHVAEAITAREAAQKVLHIEPRLCRPADSRVPHDGRGWSLRPLLHLDRVTAGRGTADRICTTGGSTAGRSGTAT